MRQNLIQAYAGTPDMQAPQVHSPNTFWSGSFADNHKTTNPTQQHDSGSVLLLIYTGRLVAGKAECVYLGIYLTGALNYREQMTDLSRTIRRWSWCCKCRDLDVEYNCWKGGGPCLDFQDVRLLSIRGACSWEMFGQWDWSSSSGPISAWNDPLCNISQAK